jgi:hypothetical protein
LVLRSGQLAVGERPLPREVEMEGMLDEAKWLIDAGTVLIFVLFVLRLQKEFVAYLAKRDTDFVAYIKERDLQSNDSLRVNTERIVALHSTCHKTQDDAHEIILEMVSAQKELAQRMTSLVEEIRTHYRDRDRDRDRDRERSERASSAA